MVTDGSQDVASYVAGLARLRAAAGALFFDEVGRVLLVKPVYKGDWEIPGGVLERGESPRAACIREVREELGIAPRIGRLLGVDWVPPQGVWDAGLMFVFDGGVLPAEQVGEVRVDAGELERWEFVPVSGVGARLVPRLARRVAECARARSGAGMYLEDGAVPAGAGHVIGAD
jgi:8-oxo-dGTP pyrophosphatase MutT (NUDIX family)